VADSKHLRVAAPESVVPRPDGECTVQRLRERFCGRPSAPGTPFPICVHHLAEMCDFLRERLAMPDAVEAALKLPVLDKRRTFGPRVSVVYYLRVGQLVKIGTTWRIKDRMRRYPPDSELLAAEPGGRDLERSRCEQFAHLLHSGMEWFHPGDDLLAFIDTLGCAA